MKFLSLSLLTVLALSTTALAADPVVGENGHNYPAIPVGPSATPSDVRGVLYAKPFTLESAYTYAWRADAPKITSGWVLVVEVTPELAVQKNTFNAVLYVGRYPAEITVTDPSTGRMVVFVPGDVDLTRDPVYFGSNELPEEVSPERAAQEMQAALTAGFRPVAAATLRLAQTAGGERVTLRDGKDLYAGPVADAIERYLPEQADWADSYRTARVETR